MKRLKRIWKQFFWVIIILGFFFTVLLNKIGCPIRTITGIPCAGCGMTRAYLALLRLDFGTAFYYHPLFWMVPLALILIIVKKGPLANSKFRTIVLSIILASFLTVYILRLLFLKSSLIYIAN